MKFEVLNAFNNQKLIGHDVVGDAPTRTARGDSLGLPTDYIQGARFGQATRNLDYPTWRPGFDGGRTLLLAFGMRFELDAAWAGTRRLPTQPIESSRRGRPSGAFLFGCARAAPVRFSRADGIQMRLCGGYCRVSFRCSAHRRAERPRTSCSLLSVLGGTREFLEKSVRTTL